NATYEPLKIVSWKKAITLVILKKVEVVEEYDKEIHTVSFSIKIPSIIRLFRFIKRKENEVKFCRQNIYARDKNQCQYCGKTFETKDLTYDHVIPKSRGGRTEWTNIVTCCIDCNRKKGGKTPEEAGLKLIRAPKKPKWLPVMTITIGLKKMPQSWRDYLYWNVELSA
ncbi:MAG: HNH endonuclease, partial [Deltaproteobacteria bacterium]|nr:HNH endonuclease [Deltaproteobacteria bacterium]